MMKSCYLLLFFLFSLPPFSQTRTYTAIRTRHAPDIDRQLRDDCWSNACWVGDFVQFDPHSGSEPSQQIVYRHRAVRYRETLLNISFRPSTSIQHR
ncbi:MULTISPECIES: DOMON domain-containing protein [Petrimonas]|uniref:hypothetical protein n=1 Tax=Petrimonas TaxID=307628 RepID=UPI001160CFF6|nr:MULTISPECIES: hypothetical protein [Petrimonas]